MKKIIFTACLLLASVGTFAQHAKGSFNIQPKVGLNVATMTDNDGSDPRVGLSEVQSLNTKLPTYCPSLSVLSTHSRD